MSILDKFTKSVGNIIKGEIDNVTNQLESKLENAVSDFFSNAIGKVVGKGTARELVSRFGDAIHSSRMDNYFNESTSASQRLTPEEICQNAGPAYAETAFQASKRAGIKDDGSSVLRFPQQESKYYTQLTFRQYQRPSPQSRPTNPKKHTIILPLPKDLVESQSVSLSQQQAGVAGAAIDLIKDRNSSVAGGKPADKVEAIAMAALASKIDESMGGQFTQSLGAIANPYVTLLFQGVGLRQFNFTWTFAPRNIKESKVLKDICNKLKASSLPAYTPSGSGTAFLEYPLLCELQFMPWGGSTSGTKDDYGEGLMRFKPCLIENVTINYSPNGLPSFFANPNNESGGPFPTFVQISLSFHETEYFVADNYGRIGDVTNVQSLTNDIKSFAEKIPGGSEVLSGTEKLVNDVFKDN